MYDERSFTPEYSTSGHLIYNDEEPLSLITILIEFRFSTHLELKNITNLRLKKYFSSSHLKSTEDL